jgi:anti-sigma regulatory factor (Ser/Thr protein kinase)
MRRRVIFTATPALYVVLLGVAWSIGTRQAEKDTNAQLDYAVMDFRDTVQGAIDTMIGYAAKRVVTYLGEAKAKSLEEMADLARHLDIDEVNVVSREGDIIASNDPHCLGVCMAGDPVMDPFMELTNGVTPTVSQPFRPHARNPKVRAKYLAVAFPGGAGFVQVGLNETRLAKMLPTILGYIFDEWLLGRTGFFLCADAETDALVSNPSRHRDEAKTLSETGFDARAASRYEVTDNSNKGRTFRQRLFGEMCYCRYFTFAGHRFIPALPEREYYDTRDMIVTSMAVLLAIVLGGFAVSLSRISRDSARLKAFYAAEEASRAKEMDIAKTIQASSLPCDFPVSERFELFASMTPARDVGGDFYDFFPLDSGRFVFLVADVSGKGISAALYMMTAKTLIKDILLSEHDLSAALMRVNDDLSRNNPANMFLTAWVGVIDFGTGRVEFVNAGHNPPIVRRADGTAVWMSEKSGPLLAFVEGAKYRSSSFDLAPGDTLFLYTDGVTEAMDAKGDLFGETRLMEAFSVAPSGEPPTLCRLVRTLVTAFAAGTPPTDDLTVLAVKYLSRPRRFVRTFTTTQAGIAAASKFLDKIAAKENNAGLNATIPTLHVILDEVASNIVRHSDASGFAVEMEVTHDGVTIDFIDDGAPYNPLLHVDPDTSLGADKRPVGGLGILMVKKMATSVAYRRDHSRNILRVSKNWNG